jgi:hypothetical protein
MTTRRVCLAAVFFVTVLSGCEDPVGTAPPPERDMFVRPITDMAVMVDAIRLDGAMVIRECEAGETRSCGQDDGECQLGIESCTDLGLWSGECLGSVDP